MTDHRGLALQVARQTQDADAVGQGRVPLAVGHLKLGVLFEDVAGRSNLLELLDQGG